MLGPQIIPPLQSLHSAPLCCANPNAVTVHPASVPPLFSHERESKRGVNGAKLVLCELPFEIAQQGARMKSGDNGDDERWAGGMLLRTISPGLQPQWLERRRRAELALLQTLPLRDQRLSESCFLPTRTTPSIITCSGSPHVSLLVVVEAP